MRSNVVIWVTFGLVTTGVTYAALKYDFDISPPSAFPKTYDDFTNEKISGLHPKIRSKIARAINNAKKKGRSYEVFSGYRSPELQNDLYDKGQTHLKGWESLHQYGLSVDIREKGKSTAGTDYTVIAKELTDMGFENPSYDLPHFEMDYGYTTSELKQKIDSGDTVGKIYPRL